MTAQAQVAAELEIRQLLDGWIEATKARDLDRIMACYTPDVIAFDAIAALEFQGAESYRRHWETCLGSMPDEMVFEVSEWHVTADGDVAFAHYLCHCGGGSEKCEQAGWMRATVCCRNTPEGWRIAHEHYSAPFDPESGKALLALEP